MQRFEVFLKTRVCVCGCVCARMCVVKRLCVCKRCVCEAVESSGWVYGTRMCVCEETRVGGCVCVGEWMIGVYFLVSLISKYSS